MTGFTSFSTRIEELLTTITDSPELHAKWLNTLSFLENCGARKIAACEHPTLVREEVLKHASEEFRHAHYLKRQINRVSSTSMSTYTLPFLLGGTATLHYLTALDLKTSRYLKGQSLPSLKEAAYLLVTYAIEKRADELYPIYDAILRKRGSRITVKSILLEEKGHLEEMKEGLNQLPSGWIHASHISLIESNLCKKWLDAIINNTNLSG